MGGLFSELGEFRLPVGAKFGPHAAFDEWPAHCGGMGLKLGEFLGIFWRQKIRNGGQHLCHFHERALGVSKRRGESRGDLVVIAAKDLAGTKFQGRARQIGSNACSAAHAGGKAVAFWIIGHGGFSSIEQIRQCARLPMRRSGADDKIMSGRFHDKT